MNLQSRGSTKWCPSAKIGLSRSVVIVLDICFFFFDYFSFFSVLTSIMVDRGNPKVIISFSQSASPLSLLQFQCVPGTFLFLHCFSFSSYHSVSGNYPDFSTLPVIITCFMCVSPSLLGLSH